MPRELLWINGRICPIEKGRISVEDRGFLFADGIYEVARFYDGKPFRLRHHLDRWEYSAREILLESPGTQRERALRIMELVEESGISEGIVYGQLTRGAARRNHLFPRKVDCPPTEMWFVRHHKKAPPEFRLNGVSILSHPDERWARCDVKAIGLLPNVLAKEAARRAGCQEALFFREDGAVTEGASSNFFCVRSNAVYTHPSTHRILPGVTRQVAIDAALDLGLEVIEKAATLDEFRGADEVFMTSTTMEVMPVTQLDHQPIGDGKVGPVTRRLMEAVLDRIFEEVAACEARI